MGGYTIAFISCTSTYLYPMIENNIDTLFLFCFFIPFSHCTILSSLRRAHARTRVRVEQVNGQVKNKFCCLLGHGMQIVPDRACNIITACCVLFNISKELREPHLDPENDQLEDNADDNEDNQHCRG